MTNMMFCKACGKEHSINAAACIHCGEPNASITKPEEKVRWYHRKGNVIPLLIFLMPVGIYAMWKGNVFWGWVRWVITIVFVLILIAVFSDESQKIANTVPSCDEDYIQETLTEAFNNAQFARVAYLTVVDINNVKQISHDAENRMRTCSSDVTLNNTRVVQVNFDIELGDDNDYMLSLEVIE
jgi:hypothetical protein